MNKELEFLEEKHGDNSWGHYPPSKREVAQWLQEWTEKQFAIHDVSYCAEQTKNVLTNKFCNIAKNHVGKTFDEVPEATELLKAIDVIEKHCS